MKAVILCGGVGSRLKPLTESVPKPLVRLMNRPVIDIIIEKLIDSGIDDISLSLGYKADDIIEFCEAQNYKAALKYFTERKPLGTAGGVKYCIDSTDEDVLVLSGDNVFDFDLNLFFDYHKISDADITVLSVQVEDPREYGVIVSDDDGSIISFIEKPSWELAESFDINTGIYLIKGSVMELIPTDVSYDFSNDLFPFVFNKELRFMCCKMNGFWGDIGEFDFLLSLNRFLLEKKVSEISFKGVYYGSDTILKNGAVIKAPCLIGKKTEIGKSSVIGPFTVCGDNCNISDKTVISGSIIGENCAIGCSTEIIDSIFSDNVMIGDNCIIDKNTVIGDSVCINRFSRIAENVKIWPGNRIPSGSLISEDVGFSVSENRRFDIFGMHRKINLQFDISDAVQLGAAVGSVEKLQKIGVGFDGKKISENFMNACLCGIRSSGKICYDFGEMFRNQVYFYSAYCSLDFFVFFSSDGEYINISFFGKNGLPAGQRLSKSISDSLKYKSFRFAEDNDIKDVFNMKLFGVVYKSFFKKLVNTKELEYSIYAECENKVLSELLSELFNENKYKKSLTVLFNKDGNEMYVIENGKYYSSDRILALICSFELAQGRKIIIPEEAADFLESEAGLFTGELLRVYENSCDEHCFSGNDILQTVWTFDCVLMFAKLLSIIKDSDSTIAELFESQRRFEISKKTIEIDFESSEINHLIQSTGAKKETDPYYYTIESRKGSVRLRRLGNSAKIRILAQSYDSETAKELAGMTIKKLKDANIDKEG
ncbi:MAG: hypothetical protein E7535_06375 [Ruminococcaceae bacterium]|nr:hypothetical protein [Oscillospiraceae bacterium]